MTSIRLSTSSLNATRRITLSVVLLVLAATPPQASLSQTAAPAKGEPVRLTLTIMDRRGRYVTSLAKDRIAVLEDGAAREITSFEQSAEPMSVGVVFDMTARNRANLLDVTKVALANFIRAGGSANRYFIIGFDREPYLAADWFGSAAEAAAGLDRLAALKPSADRAALYDAVRAALVKAAEGPHARCAVILVSDGRNDGSKVKRDELLEAVRRSDALIYAVASRPPDSIYPDASDDMTLGKLASTSGGFTSSVSTAATFLEFFERLSVEFQHQYSVSFRPADAGGAWRRLSFKATPLDVKKSPASKDAERIQLTVRGREGYYSNK